MSSSSSISGRPCRREIPPEIFQAFGTAKKGREMGRVDQQNVTRAFARWLHPQKAVHLGITCSGKWMRTISVYRLLCKYVYLFATLHNFVMRQMRMKIKRGHIFQKPEFVQIAERGK